MPAVWAAKRIENRVKFPNGTAAVSTPALLDDESQSLDFREGKAAATISEVYQSEELLEFVISEPLTAGSYVAENRLRQHLLSQFFIFGGTPMKSLIPRILFAGTNSGCGKTTVTCAVLQALVNRGLKTGAFKCGPDYIDPMFHSRIIGARSSNLDLFFFPENTLRYLLSRNAAELDISVIEGVMGYYDGMGLSSVKASTYDVARVTESPVILVVNAKGLSMSLLAVIQGFLSLNPDHRIQGVVLNRCTTTTYPTLKKMILEHFDGTVQPLGFLPSMPECALESRHLGLITAEEVAHLKEKMQILAEQAEKYLDLDGMIQLAGSAPEVIYEPVVLSPVQEPVRIAVARDRAFCFYYEDSLQALQDLGAELVSFSPLRDSALPENIHGIYLGGGYPELYAETLSRNCTMLNSIRSALAEGLPCIAECGGFMYLTKSIGEFSMVGYLKNHSYDTGKLCRFGYVTLTAKKDNMLCAAGQSIQGHEFHHWDCSETGSDFTARKSSGKQWDCVITSEHLYAGYPHFHFYSNPVFAENFIEACRKEKHRHD